MTKEKVELMAKLGPKGQIILKKEIRRKLGLSPGMLLRERMVKKRIVLETFDWEEELRRVKKIAKLIGKKWPKELTSVDVIRKERK